jgi:hypothetical protein
MHLEAGPLESRSFNEIEFLDITASPAALLTRRAKGHGVLTAASDPARRREYSPPRAYPAWRCICRYCPGSTIQKGSMARRFDPAACDEGYRSWKRQ